ncbi:glycine zipper 2TM domain-containing protein (plasmid) [Sphingobium sp. V4]|uniref:glycine zipper 2TM domain-containing protein n=1 Tax=Sphingobium sp. V4 TaxID=3038927 RepID=UPI0025583685|nr:glycine zipper 2TM domain-containing protein [Sphingobium sp. V4]WIW90374.1 glycine zipper 2TM domain-containing protein [Sphingobium sp. V4]
MTISKSMLALAAAAATLTAVAPATSFARDHDRGWYRGGEHARYVDYRGYRDDRGYRCRKSGGTTGLLLGGVAGALLGRAIDTRGDRAPGTIIGAGAGALAGRAIDRNSNC